MRFRVKYEGDKIHIKAFSNNKKDKVPLARETWSLRELKADKSLGKQKMEAIAAVAAGHFEKNRGLSRYKSSKGVE